MNKTIKKFTINWQLKLGIFFAIMLIVSAVLKILTPKTIILQDNTWNNLNPGVSSAQDLVAQLGTPQKVSQQKNLQIYEYQYKDESTINTQVGINNNQTISFIKERLKYDPNHTLSQYTDKFGDADLELYPSIHTGVVKAYIFLNQGVAIFAHQKDLSVEQKWYFEPTTKEIFIKSWERELFSQDPGPEVFN